MDELTQLSNLLDSITKIETNSVKAACELLLSTKAIYSDHKDDVIKQYDLSRELKFNIFETISDLYKREKFHSDILFTILDSKTPEIGAIYNKEILEEFVRMVDSSFNFIVDDTVKVSKEESNKVLNGDYEKQGYIDLLITNSHNQAIIIENKINYAPDMDNQLVRYMKYVKEQIFENEPCKMRVVYLTMVSGKIPDIDGYDEFFAEYKEMLADAKNGDDGKILKYRSAVDCNKDKPDLDTFLNNCIKLFDGRTDDKALLKKVYMEQYKTLLDHLGGNAAMLEYQKDLLKEIFSSPEKLKAVKDLVEVFNEESINTQYINNCLKPLLENKEMGFTFEDNWLYKVWNKDHTVNLYVTGQWGFQIGFNTKDYFTEEEQLKYEKILADVLSIKTKANETEKGHDGTYVWVIIKPFAGKNNMDEFWSIAQVLFLKSRKCF